MTSKPTLEIGTSFAADHRVLVVRGGQHHFHPALAVRQHFLDAVEVDDELPVQSEEFLSIQLLLKPVQAFVQRQVATFPGPDEGVLLLWTCLYQQKI